MRSSNRPRKILLPNNFVARDYQVQAMAAMDSGKRFAFLVWHRRAGKDTTFINYTAAKAHERVGLYFHMLPTQRQAKRVIWNAINPKTGVRMIDQAFPKELRKRTLEDEMLIEFKNGSIWQLVGSDNYDAIVGTNPAGIVFSEWSLSNPRVFDYMRPIFAENDGWAVFIGTPRGKNWFYDQYQRAQKSPDWYCDLKTVTDTGAISLERIEADRLSGMSEDRVQQEYWCSFDAKTIGLIYDSYIAAAESQGRLAPIEYDPRYPVETAWDLGYKDATSIWFVQRVGNQIRLIDFHEERNRDLPYFAKLIKDKPYVYSRHIGPHDTNKYEWGAGNTILELARQHGIRFTIAPKSDVEDGIEAVRSIMPRLHINTNNCLQGIRSLRHYHYESDAEEQDDDAKVTLSTKPKHDWASHCCDALRYLAVTPESQGLMSGWAADMIVETSHQSNWATEDPEIAAAIKRANQRRMHGQQMPNSPVEAYDPLAAYG